MTTPDAAKHVYDAAPLRPFHLRVTVASFGGVFSDGFGLGIVGVALAQASAPLGLTPLWLGLLGAASLAGLFLGALLTGPAADRFGRRPIFGYNMLALGVLSALQFVVRSPEQLLLLRLSIGFLLGTDYVVSKALLTEFTPAAFRARVMSTLSVAWAGGYTCAYFVGYLLRDGGPDAWRWMLATSALPCLAILLLRWTLPESPLWLVAKGRTSEAIRVVERHIGANVMPPAASTASAAGHGQWSNLFSSSLRRNTLVGCVFFTAQVIPYFAVGTFVNEVLRALAVEDDFIGGLAYNAALLSGAVLGLLTVDRMPRRVFLIGSFLVTAGALLLMLSPLAAKGAVSVVLFA
ncbi:MAG: MFS transporter, partial [Steroidobacteraceae bacterium]